MKKIFVISILLVLLAGFFVGCGDKTTAPTPSKPEVLTLTAEEFISQTADDPYVYPQGQTIKVSGKVKHSVMDGGYLYVYLGPSVQDYYVIAAVSLMDYAPFERIIVESIKNEEIMIVVRGKYDGFRKASRHTGPVLKYAELIERVE